MSGSQGGLHGGTRSSWWNSNIKRNFTNNGTRVGFPRRNIETLSNCVGMELGKPKLIWSWVEARDMNVKKKHFFTVRVIKYWNTFLRGVGMCPSLGISKAQLEMGYPDLSGPALSRGAQPDNLQRSLPDSMILWFCHCVYFTFLFSIFDQ